jgi:putative membrane protein
MTQTPADRRLATLALLAVGALLLIPGLGMGLGMAGMGPTMGGTWGHMDAAVTTGGWTILLGVAMQVLALLVLVGGGYLTVRALTGTSESTDTALEELRSAYARGEIDDEEFERRRAVLEREH